MAISNNRGDREQKKFKESTTTANQVGVVVLNPDGTNVSSGGTGASSNQVQGAGASGATKVGNPVLMGGVNNTTQPTLTDGQTGDLQSDTRANLKTTLMANGTATAITVSATNADGRSTSATASRFEVVSDNYVYNGTTYDRMRGDTTGVNMALYPATTTVVNAASGNVANASAAATLAGTSGKTTYITGFEITATGATAASVVSATVTGTISTTLTYTFAAPAGATVAATPLIVEFPRPIPASTTNTAIVVTLPALGAGNTNAAVVAHGFQL